MSGKASSNTKKSPQKKPTPAELSVSFTREAVVVFLCATLFYYLTSCPTIGFGDTAIMVDAIERLNLSSHVNNHPLTVLVGWFFSLFSSSEPAKSANLVSVFFGGLTISICFIAIRKWGCSSLQSTIFTLPVIVLHSMWWHSTIIENYAASAFLTALTYFFLIDLEKSAKPLSLYLAALCAGLSIFNHVQNSILCAGVGVAGILYGIRKGALLKTVLYSLGFALIGLIPWMAVLLKDSASGIGLKQAFYDAVFGKFQGTFFSAQLSSILQDMAFIFWNQSPLLLLPVSACLGFIVLFRSSRGSSLFWGALVHTIGTTVVFSGYPTWDRFAFLLTAFIGLSIIGAIGLRYLWSDLEWGSGITARAVSVWCILTFITAPVLYSSATTLASIPNSIWSRYFSNGYSSNLYNQAEFIANPNKREYRDVETFANALFATLPQNAIYLDDDSRTYYPLADYYQKYLQKRSDIKIALMNSWGFPDWGLDGKSIEKLVEDSYYMDKPFFLPSIGQPYAPFLAKVKSRIPLEFVPVPINKQAWVYRLETSSERVTLVTSFAERSVSSGQVVPIIAVAASNTVNVTSKNVLSSTIESMTQQQMESYGPQWHNSDHLFLVSGNTGSETSMVLLNKTQFSKKISIAFSTAPDFGDLIFTLGSKKVAEVSGYSSSVSRAVIRFEKELAPGTTEVLTVRCVGKSELSTGYRFGIDSVKFE